MDIVIFFRLDIQLCFCMTEGVKKPSTQVHMWFLMQHVLTLVGNLLAKIHDKTLNRFNTVAFL
jgi:pheromone shutdown protein TraB